MLLKTPPVKEQKPLPSWVNWGRHWENGGHRIQKTHCSSSDQQWAAQNPLINFSHWPSRRKRCCLLLSRHVSSLMRPVLPEWKRDSATAAQHYCLIPAQPHASFKIGGKIHQLDCFISLFLQGYRSETLTDWVILTNPVDWSFLIQNEITLLHKFLN